MNDEDEQDIPCSPKDVITKAHQQKQQSQTISNESAATPNPPTPTTTTKTTPTTTTTTNNNIPMMRYKCSFQSCAEKSWFPGFNTSDELYEHMQLHRCQWICYSGHSERNTPCLYVPREEEDFKNHLEHHLQHDQIPHSRTSDGLRILYFCPWQTCDSKSFGSRGISNKAHIAKHIRNHLH